MKWLRCHGRSPFMNWFMVWMSASQKSRLMVSTEKTTSTPDAWVKFEASFVRWTVHCSSKISNLLLSPPWSNKGLLDVLMIKFAINFSRVTFVQFMSFAESIHVQVHVLFYDMPRSTGQPAKPRQLVYDASRQDRRSSTRTRSVNGWVKWGQVRMTIN